MDKLKYAVIDCGDFTITSGKMPEGFGTGDFGMVERGNFFEIKLPIGTDSVTIDGVELTPGCIARAKEDNPKNDMNKWRITYA